MFSFYTEYFEESHTFVVWFAKQSDIDQLVCPNTIETLRIMGDYFDHITVPEGVKNFECVNVCLKSVVLPDSIEFVYVGHNKLSTIEIPPQTVVLAANDNIITYITFRKGEIPSQLTELDLSCNRLVALNFTPPETLDAINISCNSFLQRNDIADAILHVIEKNPDTCAYLRPLRE